MEGEGDLPRESGEMIAEDPRNWLRPVFEFHKTDTFRSLLPLLVGLGLFTAVVSWVEMDYLHMRDTHPLRNGGWGNVLVDHVNSDSAIRTDPTYAEYQKDTRRAMAYKLEYNLGSTFNGELLESAHNYNNGTDLRANFILTFNPD